MNATAVRGYGRPDQAPAVTPAGPYDTREAAVADGRDSARNLKVEHIIRGLDGRIHERNSYGNDPRNVAG